MSSLCYNVVNGRQSAGGIVILDMDTDRKEYTMADVVKTLPDQTDAMAERNRTLRTLTAVLCTSCAFIVPTYVLYEIGASINLPGLGLALGVGFGFWLTVGRVAKHLLVNVPQMQAIVAANTFSKRSSSVVYGPGKIAFRYPWEKVGSTSNVPLAVITAMFSEAVPGFDTQHLVKGSYQYRVRLKDASAFIGIGEVTIQQGIGDLILAQISTTLAPLTLEKAKGRILRLNNKLLSIIGGKDDVINALEKLYAIDVVKVTITSIDPTDEIQRARDSKYRAVAIFEAVAALFGVDKDGLSQMLSDGKITVAQLTDARAQALADLGVGTLTTVRNSGGGRNINVTGTGGLH